MVSGQSLARRIVTAFVLMTVAVAGLFSLSISLTVSTVEDQLVSDSMNRHLDFVIAEAAQGRTPNIGPDLTLHITPTRDTTSAPPWLQDLAPGLHEQVFDDEAFHVLVRDDGEQRYYLVLDQEEFERREITLFRIVSIGFVLCVLAAWALGAMLARTVIAPVVRLSNQVQHRDQLLPVAPQLAPDYANDEVGKLAAAFDTTLGQLRQAFEREQLFTSDVSHELRTPLMIIASSCEILLEQGHLSAAQRTQLERISRASGEMSELVETFLGLARAPNAREAGGASSRLSVVADEQALRWHPEAESRGLKLEVVTEASDDGQYQGPLLRVVMSNLLRNAVHYTDHGFVRLALRHRGFSVIDSGAGIPEDQRTRVFQPFIRGDASRGDGIGIGLSLVQRICNRQGWMITLAAHAGGGCEFRVDFGSS